MADETPRNYPAFSTAEYERRWEATRGLLADHDLDCLLVYGDSGTYHHDHANVHYLANYLGHGSSYLVVFADPGVEPTLLIELANHHPFARESSVVDDIRWGGVPLSGGVLDRLAEVDGRLNRVGIAGVSPRHEKLIPHGHYERFDEALPELVDVTVPFQRLRRLKSDEEVGWLREGARLTDRAMEALEARAEPGVHEYELKAALESAYVEEGGQLFLTFLSSAPMEGADPGEPLPWQEASRRRLERGDVVTTELSASYMGYPGQIHRPLAVGSPPSDTYRDMFSVARETYENVVDVLRPGATARDVADAAAPIVESDYAIDDPHLHGFGTVLEPPFVGTEESNYWPGYDDPVVADWEFEAGHAVVVQPNVVTPDERHALQLGAAAVVTDDGVDVLQEYPVEFVQV
jgi:Xaa-Pro aminopeptidase